VEWLAAVLPPLYAGLFPVTALRRGTGESGERVHFLLLFPVAALRRGTGGSACTYLDRMETGNRAAMHSWDFGKVLGWQSWLKLEPERPLKRSSGKTIIGQPAVNGPA
jgi:hypothetical protein